MCYAQSGASSQRSNDSSVYSHNKNGKPWRFWRRPCDKRSEPRLLGCPKVKRLSAVALTRSVRWNRVSPSRHEELYRGCSKTQIALSRLGDLSKSPCRLKLQKLPPSLKLRRTNRRGVSHRAESALLPTSPTLRRDKCNAREQTRRLVPLQGNKHQHADRNGARHRSTQIRLSVLSSALSRLGYTLTLVQAFALIC